MSRSYRVHIEIQDVPESAEAAILKGFEEEFEGDLELEYWQWYLNTISVDGTIRLAGGKTPDECHTDLVKLAKGHGISTSWWHEDREPDESFYTEVGE